MSVYHLRILLSIARQNLISFLEFIIVPLLLSVTIGVIGFTAWKSIAWFELAASIKDDPSTRIAAETEIMKTIANIFGGAFVLVGIYFSAKSIFVSREGQLADRFGKALENFDDERSVFKRIGGVHSLERLARDSPSDYWDVIEIFTSYIRNQPGQTSPPANIQVILNAIRRRRRIFGMGESQGLDLSHSNLRGVDLSGAHLGGAKLVGADLTGANLSKTDLSRANLTGAILESANLNQTRMNKTLLKGARLHKARLRNIKAKEASFAEADMREAEMDGAYFKNAQFERAVMDNASLDGAILYTCSFNDTSLHEVSLLGTYLYNSDSLTEEQLKDAITNKTRIF